MWIDERRSPHVQFSKPIVFWRYKDGSIGVAASDRSKPPKGADRIECNNRAEYQRYSKELNQQFQGRENKRQEDYMRVYEQQVAERRGKLSWLMANESDPAAREIYREALERKGDPQKADLREWYSEVME